MNVRFKANVMIEGITKTLSERKKDVFIFLFLIAMAFYCRLLYIAQGAFFFDTLELALQGSKTLDTLQLHYMHWPGYPFAVLIAALFIFLVRLLGNYDPVYAVNLMSVTFGSLSVGVFYLFTKKILNRYYSIIVSIIVSFFPLHFSLSTFGLNHTLAITLYLLSAYCMVWYGERHRLTMLVFSAVFLGCGTAARLSDAIFVVPLLFFLWASRPPFSTRWFCMVRMVFFLAVASAVTLLFYMPFFAQERLYLCTYWHFTHTFYHLFRMVRIGMPELLSIPGIVVAIIGGFYFFLRGTRVFFYFLFMWFLVLFIYYGSLNTSVYKNMLFSLIPLIIMQGYCFIKAPQRSRLFFVLFLCVGIAYNLHTILPMLAFRHSVNLQERFGKMVQNVTPAKSYIIASDMVIFIEYYGKRNTIYRPVITTKEEADAFCDTIDTLLEEKKPVYITQMGIEAYDFQKYFLSALQERYRIRLVDQGPVIDWYQFPSIRQRIIIERLFSLEKK